MKIGILTFHRAHNYGAMLQAYALRTVLEEAGHYVNFIDYWPYSHQTRYRLNRPLKGNNLLAKAKSLVADILTFNRRYKRIKQFERFSQAYLNTPKQIKYPQDQQIISEQHDVVIVGSDQIWRNYITPTEYVGFDPVYFCQNFTHKMPCFSYAASMGIINMTREEKTIFSNYLRNFQKLLVRESNLNELIRTYGFQSDIVLDPTLLLSKQQWNLLLPSAPYRKKKYVLYYDLLASEQANALAKKQAESMNCELLIIDSSIHVMPRKGHISTASPIEFVHAIRDAEYIIATSFHGTVFSIIFEKQFLTMGLGDNANRVITLLNLLQIGEQYSEESGVGNTIDYSKVSPLLKKHRDDSLNALHDAINNIELQ